MNEIEHEGKTYILKSSVESIVKERVSKVAARANEAESRASDLEKQVKSFESKQASYDVLASQVSDLKTRLQSSDQRFSRYQAISKIGITDPDIIDVLEFQYDKAMKDQKDKISLSDWMDGHMANLDDAPSSIRPFLKSVAPKPPQESAPEPQSDQGVMNMEQMQSLQQHKSTEPPPNVNNGAIRAPDQKDVIQRAMTDQDYYNQNADAIRKAWLSRYGLNR